MNFVFSFILMIFALAQTIPAPAAEPLVQPSKFENFYISGDIAPDILREFKAQGGDTVINVKDFSENGECGAAPVAAKLGLKFYMSPLPKSNPFTKASVGAVDKLVKSANGKPVLIYCSTGNRAAGFLAIYLAHHKNMATDDAVTIAKLHGLTSPFIETLVRDFAVAK